jgi:hypothetical protein
MIDRDQCAQDDIIYTADVNVILKALSSYPELTRSMFGCT